MRQTADIVYLTHHQLRGTAGEMRTELNLNHDLHEVLTGWTGSRPGLLLLDGIDQTRGVDASSWLPGLAQHLRATRWRIVASIRSFDLRRGRRWQSMFSGTPVDLGHADPELSQVAHLVVSDLTAGEIATVHAASPSIRQVFDQAGDDLAGLLANPFNLNLVGELVGANMDISQIRSRLDLLTRFWQLRVVDAPDWRVRQRALQSLVVAMVAARSQQSDDSQLDDSRNADGSRRPAPRRRAQGKACQPVGAEPADRVRPPGPVRLRRRDHRAWRRHGAGQRGRYPRRRPRSHDGPASEPGLPPRNRLAQRSQPDQLLAAGPTPGGAAIRPHAGRRRGRDRRRA